MYGMTIDTSALHRVRDAFGTMPEHMKRELGTDLKKAGVMVLDAATPLVPVGETTALVNSGKVSLEQGLGGPEIAITYGGNASKYVEPQFYREDYCHSLSAAIVKASRRHGQEHLLSMTRQRAKKELKAGGLTWWEEKLYTSMARGYQNPKAKAHWLFGKAYSAWETTRDKVTDFLADASRRFVERLIGKAAGGGG